MKAKAYTTKFCSKIIWRPICLLIILGLAGLIIWRIWVMTKQNDGMVGFEGDALCRKSISSIKAIGKFFYPLNQSAITLAKALNFSRNQTQLSNLSQEEKVPQELLLTLSMNPHLSQISYIGSNGQLFSICSNNDNIVALFSNYSAKWYRQLVNWDTGKLYGKPELIISNSSSMETVNTSWFQEALNNPSGFSWVGKGWMNDKESLFLTAVPINSGGVISVGLPAKVIVDQFAALNFYGEGLLATINGYVVIKPKLTNTRMMVENQSVTIQVVNPNRGLVSTVGNFSCQSDDGESTTFYAKLGGNKYLFSCSTMDIFGVHMVYVLACTEKGVPSSVHKNSKLSLVLLIVLFVFMAISICVFLFFIIKSARREVFLCAALVKQRDATKQAERKSMNKTTAFNRANHDVRASLGAVSALTKLCQDNVRRNSILASNLAKIQAGIDDLFGILNSMLDFSKIEAGKMELEEEEFNLAQFIEEVVDMFYQAAISKGVDLVLDPSDGSIIECCIVRGDKVKLKQILWNLLSNAVKFTSEGHITVRAMLKKPSFENAIIASNTSVLVKCLTKVWVKNKEDFNNLNALQAAHQDPNLRDFVIEVDDTGKGIPKDLQKSVFEKFFQVKGSSPRQEGTGLGLGIVQSLVRLMGGDIRIVDKGEGEKGTCFNFNIKLIMSESEVASTEEEHPLSTFQHFALRRGHSPKANGSHVVLLITNDERRRVLTKYIESLNIKVSNVKGKDLMPMLEKIKGKLNLSNFSHSGKSLEGSFDSRSLSQSTSINSQLGMDIEGTSGAKDAIDHISLPSRKTNSKNSPGILVIVIDASADVPSELDSFLGSFKKEIHGARCKIVWLDDQPEETCLARPMDYVVSKPFHGSRLYQVLGLIPELKKCNLLKLTMEFRSVQEIEHPENPCQLNELEKQDNEAESTSSKKTPELEPVVIQNVDEETKEELLLSGKKILVADDHKLLRMITKRTLIKLGAEVEECENGKEAFDKICQILSDHLKEEQLNAPIYDYVFMDCEMPGMNGFEATRLIRVEEQRYNVRIPIIALTAHAISEELSKTMEAGMDGHLTKPLRVDSLLQIINSLKTKSLET